MKTTIFNSFVILITLLTIKQSYSQWQQTGMTAGNVSSIAGNDNKIFAGAGALYYTANNGANWSDAGIDNNSFQVGCNGNNVFAVPTAQSSYIYVSHDNGITWATPFHDASGFLSMAVDGNNVYSGAIFDGLAGSTNNGVNWNGLYSIGSVYRIAANGNNIFLSKEHLGNIYYTTNSGSSWSQTTLSSQPVYSIAINGSIIYAGTQNNGIYISTNNGTSWSQSSLNNHTILSIASVGSNVFAGTDLSGIYYSGDNGLTWNQINDGLTNLNVGALFISNNYIYAGTGGSGVWKRPLSDVLAVHNISTEVPKGYNLFQNYPNPFNPNSKIKFQITKSGNAKLIVFDVQGKAVSTLVNEELKPGTYEVNFDGSKYSSGIYFYKLETGNYSETKKMLMVK